MKPATVVVVNDDVAYIEMVSDLLTDEGYRARSCTGSREAYRLIKHEQPDLVLLDIHMETPDSGMNVLTLLRLDRETQHIPVIVCTADNAFLRMKADRLREYGCQFLEKRFLIDDLSTMIAELLEARPQEQEHGKAIA